MFATRDAAQTAIDEVHRSGFGSDRRGVAVREAVSRAFERDADTELVHDTATGIAAGPAIGAFNEREEFSITRLEPGQVPVAVCSHGRPATVQAIMQRHGGELMLRPRSTSLDPSRPLKCW